MMLHAALIALLLQAAPAARPPAQKATVAGVVVNANGEPLPNIRVALGRTDMSLGPLSQMMSDGNNAVDLTIPGAAFEAISDELTQELERGTPDPRLASQATAFKALPLGEIHEAVLRPGGVTVVVMKATPPTVTDDRGRFVFNDVEPGTYQLMFSGNGYARQSYGQRSSGGGVPINLTPGQAKTDITMRMLVVAAVSGRIRDAAGAPIAAVTVQLYRVAYDATGQRKMQRITAARTDDRGEYRMYYLTPGRYYMSAGNLPGENQQNIGIPSGLEALILGAGYVSPNRATQNYTIMYYPGVPEESSATPVDLQSGDDVRGLDLFLSPQQTFRVRGRVVDSRTGQPPTNASVNIRAQTPSDLLSIGLGFSSTPPTYRPTDGTFDVANVSVGTYTVTATLPNQVSQRIPDLANLSPAEQSAFFEAQQLAQLGTPRAAATVRVTNGDVEGVLLSIGVSSSLNGRIRAESSFPPEALNFLQIQLRGADPSTSDPLSGGGPQIRAIKPDGTFRVDNVWPGNYRLGVGGLPPGFYVKEARLGDSDVLNDALRVTGPDSSVLDIAISANVGKLDGTATDAAGQPAAGAQVVLIPSRNDERPDLFRSVTADSNGRYSIPSIAPGDYTLAVWDALEPNAYFDPNLIRAAESNGKALHVAEASSQTVNATLMPASTR